MYYKYTSKNMKFIRKIYVQRYTSNKINLYKSILYSKIMLSSTTPREIAENVAIATSTFYNFNNPSDIIRANCARNMIRNAIDLGYSIALIDGGSPGELLDEFRRYGVNIFAEIERGMGKGRRQSFQEAYNLGKPVVAWIEPEKEHYIRELWKTTEPILEGKTDLVVPKRKSLDSYPEFQAREEELGNLFFKNLTGYDLDVWFGPRTWGRDITNCFTGYDGKFGDKWESIFMPILKAIHDGKRVSGVEINYTHPKEQTEIEKGDLKFDLKRIEQLSCLTNNMYAYWQSLKS